MRLIWSGYALDDLIEIWSYVAVDDAVAAEDLIEQIDAAANVLASFPGAGRAGRIAGTREYAVPRTRYVLAYHVTDDAVEVLRVLHGARRWPEGLS